MVHCSSTRVMITEASPTAAPSHASQANQEGNLPSAWTAKPTTSGGAMKNVTPHAVSVEAWILIHGTNAPNHAAATTTMSGTGPCRNRSVKRVPEGMRPPPVFTDLSSA